MGCGDILGSGAEGKEFPQLRKGTGAALSKGGSWKITEVGAGRIWDIREPQAQGWGSGEVTERG